MTAPMPRAVKETGPSVFFNACSGISDSEISLSIDLVRKICLASALAPAYRRLVRGGSTAHAIQIRSKNVVLLKSETPPNAATPLTRQDAYRLLWPREAFLTLALFSPRAPVRGPFGAAFLRAARFTFFRSSLSVMLLVFAMVLANLSIGAIFGT
jgi:hypothetical protein